MSPELQETLNHLEDIVALKLSGGKLLGHVKVAERGRFETAAPVAVPTETGRVEGEGVSPPAAGVTPPRESGDLAFLEGSKSQARQVGAAGDGGKKAKEMSQEPSAVSPPESASREISPPLSGPEQTTEAAKKKAENEDKGRGRIYQEGEEEELFVPKGFNWLRLLIILLIVILVTYIGFEIFKAAKSTRIGK